ncbi:MULTISPECIES: phosphate ABC transporter substrate-binding protein [Brevibacillus]|uniref:phosphate ABC transporter substrate-binding protein n=1 Tax=Brevibacillus TaxID=55080 RepID=UPI000D10BA9E|nr:MULTISPECIES: phosphate ABC transporter substrate-binding protein [Brevibacillus]MED1948440.1 phosphate ABC transporter substrate-binding protein [Brevibacillus formosus]MED1997681.1 phosphate ABC transporter substrate-binding protein [Brevibacillus formosus]MED2083749.1 phosphate ABC transporter substrate-binding protein [Brevibacillus formosus]PSK15986.1 phosphate-binding protein [Brevibacillus sp. NRRL NRS-603]
MKKLSKMFIALTCVGALLAGCGSGNTAQTQTQTPAPAQQPAQEQSNSGSTTKTSGEPVTAVGSTALQPLVEQAAKDFMAKNAGAQIQVQGGGSGTGLSQVASGAATIGNSDIFAEEKKGIPANELVDHKVAVVGMAAAVSPQVKVDNLSKQQLIDIFTGKITNWKEVGGDDMKITLVNRPKSSGTRATFSKFALDGKEEAEGITEDSSGTVRKIIAETPGAIGYLALSYFNDSVKALKLDGVEANAENITTNKYPVWAYEHMYTKGEATGDAKAFLDFILTDEVQKKTVTELGFLPITDMKVERDAEGKVTQK